MFTGVVSFFVIAISKFASKEIAFAVAFAIILSSLALWTIAVYRPHRLFRKALAAGISAAKSAAADATHTPADRIALIDRTMRGNAVLEESWFPYRSALKPDPLREGQFLNPVDPYGWFALEKLPGRGYEKWASTLAGVSLTVGLLFTFIGLSAALFKVGQAGSNTAELRQAIADILSISSAKFITSMAGIITYIGWTLVARHYASTQSKLVLKFAAAVQSLSVPVTPEALLFEQLEQAREQTTKLRTLSDDIAVVFDSSLNRVLGQRLDGLPAAMGDVLRPALEMSVQPVVRAIASMGGSIGADNQTAIKDLVGNLMTEIKSSTGEQMTALAQAMKEAADELKAAKAGIGTGGEVFGETLARAAEEMSTASRQMATALTEKLGAIGTTLTSGADEFRNVGSAMTTSMADTLTRALLAITTAASEGAQLARGQAQAELAPVLEELKALMGKIRESADDSRGALVAGGQAAADDLRSAMAGVGKDLSATSTKVSADLTRQFSDATAGLLGTADKAMAEYRAATEALASRLAAVERGFASIEAAVQQNAGHLEQSSGALASAGRTFSTAAEQVRQVAEPIQTSLISVERAASSAQEAMRLVQANTSVMQEAARALETASTAAAQAFGSYERRFTNVDDELGRTLERLKDASAKIGETITDAVGKYDEHLGRALNLLRGAVADLGQFVEDLGPRLAEVET